MLPPVYSLLTADVGVTALVGTRIYRHGAAPQKVVAPYITWSLVSGTPENELSSLPRVDRLEVQIDCWSNNTGTGDAEVESVATAVRDALEPVAHMTAIVANEQDFETRRYRLGLQFTFWLRRTTIAPPVLALGLSGDESGVLLLSGDMSDDPNDRELVT